MNFRNAFTGKIAQYFGLTNDEKLSASGTAGFAYQLFAVLFMTGFALFSNDAAPSVGPIAISLVTAAAAVAFIGGARLLCVLFNRLIARITAKVPNKILAFPVQLVLVLSFTAAVLAMPGAVIFILAKCLPNLVHFTTWAAASMSGIMVIAADSILSQFTGVSLLAGKVRSKSAAQADVTAIPAAGVQPTDDGKGAPSSSTTDGADRKDAK